MLTATKIVVPSRAVSATSKPSGLILLVEDEENDAALITRALERSDLDMRVESVPGGLQALAYLSGDPPYHDRTRHPFPTIVLLDIRMPGLDGFEVLRWIRSYPEAARLPVVVLTSSDKVADADLAYKLGANSFFMKPLDFNSTSDLSRAIGRLISSRPR